MVSARRGSIRLLAEEEARKNRSKVAAVVCVVGLLPALMGLAQQAPTSAETPAVREFQMTAKKYTYEPNVITVKKGEAVRLIITALDRKHAFKLKEFGIDQILLKGAPTTIEFTADKAGTFRFKYSVFCGFGHGRMKGKLVVEDDSNPQ